MQGKQLDPSALGFLLELVQVKQSLLAPQVKHPELAGHERTEHTPSIASLVESAHDRHRPELSQVSQSGYKLQSIFTQ